MTALILKKKKKTKQKNNKKQKQNVHINMDTTSFYYTSLIFYPYIYLGSFLVLSQSHFPSSSDEWARDLLWIQPVLVSDRLFCYLFISMENNL